MYFQKELKKQEAENVEIEEDLDSILETLFDKSVSVKIGLHANQTYIVSPVKLTKVFLIV